MLDALLGIIGMVLYPLFSIIFLIIQILQSLFMKFAGIGDVSYGDWKSQTNEVDITSKNTGKENETGLLYYILTSDTIKNIFISIAILAIFLIIIFSTLAALKSIYSEKPKSWRDIVTNAVKGLTSFIILPVCCLLGVWVGNILLQAIAGATSANGDIYLDRSLFISCAYNANYMRRLEEDGEKDGETTYSLAKTTVTSAYRDDIIAILKAYGAVGEDFTATTKITKAEAEKYAQVIDTAYGTKNDNNYKLSFWDAGITGGGFISIYDWGSVAKCYSLWSINYLLLVVGGVFMMYVLVNVTYGMVKRLFILMMLFVISPAVCAMYPLDEGNAVKSWTGDVRKNITSAYGAVAGMNLFFCFAPVIQNINVFGNAGTILFIGDIVKLILLICGLFCVNEFINLITNYFGLGNAYADGKSLRSSTKGALKTNVKRVGGYVGAFTKANAVRKSTGSVGKGAKTFFSETFGKAGKNVLADYGFDWNLKEGNKKAVEDYYKTFNDKIKKEETKKNIGELNTSKADFVKKRVEEDKAKNLKEGKGWNDIYESMSTNTWESYFDKNKAKDTGKLSTEDYLKILNISSKDDVANAIREIAKANNLNDKDQSALAEKIAVEYNKHRKPGEKLMNAEDVVKERDKAITREKTEEAKTAAFKGMADKSVEVETKATEITTRGETTVEADYLEVKKVGIETASKYATETNSNGEYTTFARYWQGAIENYNLYKDKEELTKELKSFVQEYESTLRRSADSQNEEMKALFNSCADTIKNKLNEAIDPKAITDAIKAGTASSTKTKDQVAKIIEELGKIVP